MSVVISWVDPKLIVDLFFGLPQLRWATPAPTMHLREAPSEYPIEVFKADCGNHNSKLTSRCRHSGDDKLDKAAEEKTEEELSSEMILGLFRPSRRPVSECPSTSPFWCLGTARRRRESGCAVD